MRLICEYPAGVLRNAVAVDNNYSVGLVVRQLPGVGKPFLVFYSLPGPLLLADFEHQSLMVDDGNGGTRFKYIVTADPVANAAMVAEMLANPPTQAITTG